MQKHIVHRIVFLLCAGIISCHNLSIPLQNSIPVITGDSCIGKVVYFPDTTVCTLEVIDLNDTVLDVSAIFADTVSPGVILYDTTAWPGNLLQINKSYETKLIVLSLPGVVMKGLRGVLLLQDYEGASSTIPFFVEKKLLDTINEMSPDKSLWEIYHPYDTEYIKPEVLFNNWVLTASIPQQQACLYTGMHSFFKLRGDFCVFTDFKFELTGVNVLNGVKMSFFISTSPDTALLSGTEAGLYIRGVSNTVSTWLRVEAAMGFESISKDINFFDGTLKITRNLEEVSLYCWNKNNQKEPEPIKTVEFSGNKDLYVHFRLSAENSDSDVKCILDNFEVGKGELVF